MSNHDNHRRGEKKRTETGPSYESANPGAGCNSTHVARSRKKWKRRQARAKRRTGENCKSYFDMTGHGGMTKLPPSIDLGDQLLMAPPMQIVGVIVCERCQREGAVGTQEEPVPALPPGWRAVRRGYAGLVTECPECLAERKQRRIAAGKGV